MVDADEEGYLLQILQTRDRPTLFLKLYRGWAKVLAQKFKALFESIESRHCEERYKNSFYIM
jgi:hypothetical protein